LTPKKRPPPRLSITLGPTWQQFVPRPEPGTELLGTLSRGAQVGALARLADGRYVQINGDWITPLNSARIEHALRSARVLPRGAGARPAIRPLASASAAPAEPGAVEAAAAAVTVRVRKRRVLQLPGGAAEPAATAAPEPDPGLQEQAPSERRIRLSPRRRSEP
jgi:hypothetical protein